MNTPISWLKVYVPDLDVDVQEFVDAMTLSGSHVEGYEKKDKNLEKIVVGKIEKIEKHPDADKLIICQVNIGPIYIPFLNLFIIFDPVHRKRVIKRTLSKQLPFFHSHTSVTCTDGFIIQDIQLIEFISICFWIDSGQKTRFDFFVQEFIRHVISCFGNKHGA